MPQGKVDTLYELIQESVAQRAAFFTADYANLNVNDYLGQIDGNARLGFPVAAAGFFTPINRIQNAVINNWTVLGVDPPKFEFKPRETGEPPVCYYNAGLSIPNTPSSQQMLQQLNPASTQADQNGNVQELTPDEASLVKSTIQQSQQVSQQAKMLSLQPGATAIPIPQPLPDELLVEITDQTCADAFQEIFDILWMEAGIDFYVRENILYTIIQGTQYLAYEWNEDESRPTVWNPEWLMVHVDPCRTDIGRAEWAVMGFLMSADEAKSRFPDVDPALIDQNASRSPQLMGGITATYPSFYRNNNYRRDMIIVWTMWQRFQPFPMDAQMAMDKGLVAPGQPDPTTLQRVGGAIKGAFNGIKNALGAGQDDPDAADDQTDTGDAQDQTGTGSVDEVPPAAPTVLRHAKTNEVVGSMVDGSPVGDHSHKMWPKRYGILQTQILSSGTGGVEIGSRECEFENIPLCQNVNIPIPQTPNGQGEPTRLRPLQRAVNDVMTIIIAQATSNAFSVQLIRRSVHEDMGEKDAKTAHVTAGRVLIINDDVADKIGGLENGFKNIEPAEVPNAMVQLLTTLVGMIDKESNMVDAPNMEGSPWSGQALEQASAPAKSQVTMKGMRVEQMLLYLAKLMDGDICSPVRLSAQKLNEMCPKYPIQVWEALQSRRKRLIVDITCELTNGSGMSKKQRQQDVLMKYNNGTGPMGQFVAQTLEDLGEDTDALIKKQIAFNQMMAASQQQSQPASAAVAPAGNSAPQQQVTAAPPQGSPPQTSEQGAQ